QIEGADEVDVVIKMRILHRDADAGHRAQMHDGAERVLAEKQAEQRAIADIAFHKSEGVAVQTSGDFAEIGFLAGRIIVVVEIIEPHDVLATRQQRLRSMAADKARCARDEYASSLHRLCNSGYLASQN